MLRRSHRPLRQAATALAALAVSLAARAPAADPPGGWNLTTAGGRAAVVEQMRAEAVAAKTAAWRRATAEGWAPRTVINGRTYELMAFLDGVPHFYVTDNADAAVSTAANMVRGVAPYHADGTGFTVGVWDGGGVRTTHQELTGRATVMDGATAADHATHVAGTIGASGVSASVRGMAPSVTLHSYDWTSDEAEMASRAMVTAGEAGKLQLSNHSYGTASGWSGNYWYGNWGTRECDYFGQYDTTARDWDTVCYAAPYYLPIKSAGNDRSDSAPSAGATFFYYVGASLMSKAYAPATDPYADGYDGGYDTIPTYGCAKNVLTVGAVNDAVSGGVRSLAGATMLGFSGWGPADDGRIKPDIVANGYRLFSSTATADTSYGTSSGTSMSTPNASGSAILLLDCFADLFPGQSMRASTLKGLIIHTADDLGNAGPDYSYGWGLMNTKAAADLLAYQQAHPTLPVATEFSLTSATPTRINAFGWNGAGAIRVTLCWTDPPGAALSGLDNATKCLVNDLDLRVVSPNGQTNWPYVLNPTQPALAATTGDNDRDNAEQVYIATPVAGVYRAVVTLHGSLTGAAQPYSLLVSGAAESTCTLAVAGSPFAAGAVTPSYGSHDYETGASPAATALSPYLAADASTLATYVCTGWVGTGSVPASGSGTNTGSFVVMADSTLTWRWALTELVVRNQTVSATTNLTARDTLRAGDGYRVAPGAAVAFRAGRSVRLTSGFSAATGSFFRAAAP